MAALGVIGVIKLVATGVAIASTLQAARTAKAAGDYNAQLADQNAILAKRKAGEEERRFRVRSRKQLGAVRSAYAAAGVTLEGSPTDILDEMEYTVELDALTLRAGGEQSAAAFEAESRLARLQGRSIQTGARLKVAGMAAQSASSLLA